MMRHKRHNCFNQTSNRTVRELEICSYRLRYLMRYRIIDNIFEVLLLFAICHQVLSSNSNWPTVSVFSRFHDSSLTAPSMLTFARLSNMLIHFRRFCFNLFATIILQLENYFLHLVLDVFTKKLCALRGD